MLPGAVGVGAAATAAPTTLTYCTPAGIPLKMDFYRPPVTRKVPVVVQVHAGAWRTHDRTTGVTPGLVAAFLKQGIAFADRRLPPERCAARNRGRRLRGAVPARVGQRS